MSRDGRKSIQYYLMPFGEFVQTFMPRWLALRVAWLLIWLAFPFLKSQRRVIAENFQHILGRELKSGEGDAIARCVLRNYATCMADLLRSPIMCRRRTLDRIVPFQDTLTSLDRLLAGGKPLILVTAHCGNWDMAGAFLAYHSYPAVAVFERITRGMSEAFNRFRGSSGMGLIGLDERRRMDEAMESGKLFVLVGDRDLRGSGLKLPWFSGWRTFPRGAAAFSLRHKAPIVIGYMILEPGDPQHRYRAVVEPVVEFQPSGDFDSDVAALTAKVVQQLERVVAQYPDQWFVYQPHWKEQ